MNKPTLYFAHPVTTYGSQLERFIEKWLAQSYEVVNPNRREHKDAYDQLKSETGDGMPYFLGLCDTCDVCAFLTFDDGSIGAGVAKEIQSFLERDAPVYAIDGNMVAPELSPVTSLEAYTILDVDATRERIRAFRSRNA